MKQRYSAEGEGRIIEVERGQKYRIRFKYKDNVTGEWAYAPQKTVKCRKAQARVELADYMREFVDEKNDPHSTETVGEYARRWHESRKEIGKCSPMTYDRDEIEIRRIEKCLGDTLVVDLTVSEIERVCVQLKRDGLSDSGPHKFYGKLLQVLKDATRKQVIPANPCEQMEPISRLRSKERKPLTEEQAISLAKNLKEAPRGGRIVAVWLALAFELRRGEALGVRWRDVALDAGRYML